MDDFILVNDVGPFKPPTASSSASASHYDDMFDSYFNRPAESPEPSPSSPLPGQRPVFDKPVFDDDSDVVNPFGAIPLFGDDGVGGGDRRDSLDSAGKEAKPEREPESVGFDDDLIAGLGGSTMSMAPMREVQHEPEAEGFDDNWIPEYGVSTKPMKAAPRAEPDVVGFDDDVIPGFSESTSLQDSTREESRTRQEKESISSSKMSVSMPDDPFVILGATSNLGYSSFGLFTDHLDSLGMPVKSESTNFDAPSTTSGMFECDIFGEVLKTTPSFSFESANESDVGENRPSVDINSMSHSNLMPQEKPVQRASAEAPGSISPEMHFTESDIHEAPGTTGFQTGPLARNMQEQLLEENPEENQYSKMPNVVWLTVSDIVLVTEPTSAPPPSRPPPPLATKQQPAKSDTSKTYPYHHNSGYHPSIGLENTSKTSHIDELEDFVMAKPAKFANGQSQILNHKGPGQDWADGRRPKGVNKGEFDSMFTSSQYQQEEINGKAEFNAYEMGNRDEEERLEHQRKQREKEEEQKRLENEREGLERESEKVRRREQEEWKRREKEKEGRQAVEKAIREARERAAAEARMQAEKEARQRAERAAVKKVAEEARARAAVEARERAAKVAAEAKERAALEARERAAAEAREKMAKAAAEARERAAAEAKERAARADAETREKSVAESQAKAAAEARAKVERAAVEKAAAEARRRAERAAVERATAEARQRAANDARERAAAEARARENQQRTGQPDLDSFFGMPSRSGSVPRSQATTTNPFDVQPQDADIGAVRRTSSGSASPFTQPPSSNLMDDLSSIFGAPSSSAVFQDVDGESEERRKARLERHQRTMERAAKAVAEKNERDLQVQWEQEERHRIGETLDFEIKRWAAGKEGNLRALLSTLQYILWPECGWHPISLTDLITAASVKKVYRKATLCIHPDKVQQKGANLQQKYIAEKVFDLLKEAWNKFNSEELF